MIVKNTKYKIKTREGYKTFSSIAKTEHDVYLVIQLDNGNLIRCSYSHIFYLYGKTQSSEINAAGLQVGMKICTKYGYTTIVDIEEKFESIELYDLIEVDDKNKQYYIESDVLTHNCQFLTSEKTLIPSEILNYYQTPIEWAEEEGFLIYKDHLEHTDSLLVLTIDPSGSGEDNTAVHLWEIAPGKINQLMTGVSPYWDATIIFKKILWLQNFLKVKYNYEPSDAYLIFERNGVGEGLSQILTQTEKAIEELEIPIFYDGKNKAGIHLGQTLKNKIALQFKTLVEYQKLIINDIEFINELYGFIEHGGSYSAKSGYKDDRIMSAFYITYYVMEVFNNFASGEFSVDDLILVNAEDKINPEEEEDDIEEIDDEVNDTLMTSNVEEDEEDTDNEDYDIMPIVI